jgi:adenylate cyclase
MESYFTEMCEIIERQNGTLDKYIGDAIMAFWGAPNTIENHEYLACKSALRCQAKVQAAGLKTRIGINTGEVFVGNIGYKNRLNYTVMGNDVNIASRIEQINKEFETNILISDTTYGAVKEFFFIRPISRLKLKGKREFTEIFELISDLESVAEEERLWVEIYTKGYEAFQEENWQLATKLLNEAALTRPNDKPTKIMLELSLSK